MSKINLKAWLTGATFAAILAILTAVVTFTNAGEFPSTWRGGWDAVFYVTISAFIAYIVKCMIAGGLPAAQLYWINFWDILKGAGMAAIINILTAVITFTAAGTFPTCWRCSGGWSVPVYAAIGFFCIYIIKNFFSNSEGKFAKEPRGI